jgi:transposase
LASARRDTPIAIARQLSCGDQTVRNAIHAFNIRGRAALQRGSTVAQHLPHTAFDATGLEQLKVIIKRSPRTFGKQSSVWTLDLLAEVCFAEGLTTRQVSGETIHATLQRLGIAWKRAKRWIRSPDPAYTPKKTAATA